MRRGSRVAVALLLSAVCAGCGNWSGFGFRADGREMQRLRQVLRLEPGTVVADVGAGKGELTFALAREVGSKGRVFSTEIDPERLRRLREAVVAAKLDSVTWSKRIAPRPDCRRTAATRSCCAACITT